MRPIGVDRKASTRRLSRGSVGRSRQSTEETGHEWPIKLELVRAILLVGLAILCITVVLPVLVGLAAAPFR